MNSKLLNLNEAINLLKEPGFYLLAGDENVLSQLPKGNWIAGTIPYFMAETGGEINQNKIFVTKVPDVAKKCQSL